MFTEKKIQAMARCVEGTGASNTEFLKHRLEEILK